MNNFRRHSTTDFSKLIKSNDLTLNMSISTENLRKLDFPCHQMKMDSYCAVKTFSVASSDIEQCKEDNDNHMHLIESLSVCKNPFEKLIKEEFRFQTESVKRMNMEISKGAFYNRRSPLCINISSQHTFVNHSQPIIDIPEIIEKDIELHHVKTSEDEKTKPVTKLSQFKQIKKNREQNIFAPISF